MSPFPIFIRLMMIHSYHIVTPVKTGVQKKKFLLPYWIPAFAGMTETNHLKLL